MRGLVQGLNGNAVSKKLNAGDDDLVAGIKNVCRAALAWTDIAGNLNVGFGTHSNLEVAYGGGLSLI